MTFFVGIFTIIYIILHFSFYVWGIALILKILNVMPIAEYTYSYIFGVGILIFIGAIFSSFLVKIFSE